MSTLKPAGTLRTLCVVALLLCLSPAVAHEGDFGKPDYDRALRVSQDAIGRAVGEYELRDPLHRVARFSDFRGRPLVVSFIYTGCFDVCPLATRFLAKSVASARAALGEDSFNVVTVGFNQPFDTPEAMAAFARQNGVSDARWKFLSPDEKTMQAIAGDFGFTYYRTPKGFDHLTQVTVVDSNGVIIRQVYGDTFELPMLVGPLKEVLSGQATARPGLYAVWQQVKLFCTVYDPNTGGYRVNYSLFVEIFAGFTVLASIAWFLLREWRRSQH